MTAGTRTVSTEVAFQLVADQRRRTIPRHLMENGDETVTIDEFVDTLTDHDRPLAEEQHLECVTQQDPLRVRSHGRVTEV